LIDQCEASVTPPKTGMYELVWKERKVDGKGAKGEGGTERGTFIKIRLLPRTTNRNGMEIDKRGDTERP